MRQSHAAAVLVVVFASACGPALVPLRPTEGDPLDAIGWIAGSWVGEDGGRTTEEHWTQPSGGTMVGMNRTITRGSTESFEYLRIEWRDGHAVYVASPGGGETTEFRAPALPREGEDRVVFENEAHDFPKRIEYRIFEGALHVRIEGEHGSRAKEWRWERATLASD